jgi:hypothetical protein
MAETISSILSKKVFKTTIRNKTTGKGKYVLVNAEELETELQAKWKNPQILGMGNNRAIYENTEAQTWEFTLYLNANLLQRRYNATREEAIKEIRDYNAFLSSLVFPVKNKFKGWVGGEPPKVLFTWPDVFTVPCRVASVKWTLKTFDFSGGVNHEIAKIKLLVDAKFLYFSEDILNIGWDLI